jgi:sugar lactone lactonase YvrE
MRTTGRRLAALAAVGVVTLVAAAPAAALEDCDRMPAVETVDTQPGWLESIAFDRKGRLFYTALDAGQLLMIPRPGAEPRVVLDGIDAPGGIVTRKDGDVLVGFGNSGAQAVDGIENPEAGLIRVDPGSGRSRIFVSGLQMANGVTRAPGGRIFASNATATGIDFVDRGVVELEWASMTNPNGLVVDREKRHLYASTTTAIGSIQRMSLSNPPGRPWFTAEDAPGAFLDGLTRAPDDTLYVAAAGSGDVWRVSGPDDGCVLMDGPPVGATAVAFGRGKGRFAKRSLFVTTIQGNLLELPHAR